MAKIFGADPFTNAGVIGTAVRTFSLLTPEISGNVLSFGAYNQADAGGFIKLNALRLRIAARLKNRSSN